LRPNESSSPTPPTAPVDSSVNVGLPATSDYQEGAAFGAAHWLGRVWQWLKEAATESGGPPCCNRNRGKY